MHRNPLPDRGGRFARKGVSVIAHDPDGNKVRVDFHLPISEGKAIYFADDIAHGKPYDGAAVRVTRLVDNGDSAA